MNHTRRTLLAGVVAGGVVGGAGCLGDEGEPPDDGEASDGEEPSDDGRASDGEEPSDEDTPDTGAYDCDLEEPDSPDEEFRPVIGDPDADIVVQAYEDFTCGGCAQFKSDQFPAIREEYIDPGVVRYEHWDLPIPVDENWAYAVASAARGVGVREGDEAFFEFTSTIYESHPNYDLEAIGDAAESVGADPCSAIADARFETYEATVAADREAGIDRDVAATPTVLVNGEVVAEPTAEAISAAIDDAL